MTTKFEKPKEYKIKDLETFERLYLKKEPNLSHCTLQALDFSDTPVDWKRFTIHDTAFLGCQLSTEEEVLLTQMGAYIYNAPTTLPYNPFRKALYTWQELMQGFDQEKDNSTDYNIYRHFSASKFNTPINEALWQRIHDHAIDDALRDLLDFNSDGMTTKKCVGFMGGHSVSRQDPFFIKTAQTTKLLTEAGFFVASGGGPGIMEAANLGAYLAGQTSEDLSWAIQTLSKAPKYTDEHYHDFAIEVLNKFPKGVDNLAVPTWFYGHEPSNLFASHIAKYFSNSIREDTLLAISLYGIVFAPGSAGTTQEIFMDATQNHYGTFNYYSPMVFLGKKRYEIDTMIFPLLKQLAWDMDYAPLLHITDEPEEVVGFLKNHPPKKVG
jgi:predicted Rossmann-fold nucleotide-binding protein